jgi:hypothetical protein
MVNASVNTPDNASINASINASGGQQSADLTAAASAMGRKGGAVKVPKGLATMSPEDKRRVRAEGLKTRRKRALERLRGK